MLTLLDRPLRLCDGLTRREWLTAGTLGPLGLSLPALLAGRARAAADSDGASQLKSRAKSCVQFFLWGGPGAQETWDIKPDAPDGTRGDFHAIDTAVPGTRICEHLPRLAARADRYTIVRSLSHTGVNHGTSAYHMLTGHIHPSPGTLRHPAKTDMPNIGANAARFLPRPDGLPRHVHLPAIINDGDGLPVPGQGPGILGESCEPFQVLGDLTQPGFRVPALALQDGLSRERLGRRVSLRQAIDERLAHLAREDDGQAVDGSFTRAVDLLQSRRTEEAFDLAAEGDAQRDRYGRHHFAQGLLLARRLVEAGVPLVTVYWSSPNNGDNQSWDTHSDQHRRMKDHLLPAFDQGLSAFLDDLAERGLLDETLVTWYGEFGRTPQINGGGGRDHWGFCQSIGLAGGGTPGGLVHGSSTRDGGYPATDAVSPDDLAATIYHLLGIDHHTLMHDLSGRPVPLSYGEVVRALCS
jgi:hypothetical protein